MSFLKTKFILQASVDAALNPSDQVHENNVQNYLLQISELKEDCGITQGGFIQFFELQKFIENQFLEQHTLKEGKQMLLDEIEKYKALLQDFK